jgi:Amt family ammonium transporter
MQVLKFLVGIRVSPEVEDAGLDISEHAERERAYADEEEFKLEMDEYIDELEEKGGFFGGRKKNKD